MLRGRLKRLYFAILVFVMAPALSSQESPSPATGVDTARYRQHLDRYCVTCHNAQLKTANILLDRANLQDVSEDGEIWEKVVRKLRTRSMPPSGMPRPENGATDAFAAYLEDNLNRAVAARPDPGRPAVSRLNRTEFGNAVRDLLAVEMDFTELLPNDDSGYRFDTVGEALSVSPRWLRHTCPRPVKSAPGRLQILTYSCTSPITTSPGSLSRMAA